MSLSTPSLTFLTRCQNFSESLTKDLGEELQQISAKKSKTPGFHIFIISIINKSKALITTSNIIAFIPSGDNLHFQKRLLATGYDALRLHFRLCSNVSPHEPLFQCVVARASSSLCRRHATLQRAVAVICAPLPSLTRLRRRRARPFCFNTPSLSSCAPLPFNAPSSSSCAPLLLERAVAMLNRRRRHRA